MSAAPDDMVRKKIRQKVARQLITSIVILRTNLQHLQLFVAEKFFDKIRFTRLCEKMLAPHIRLSKFRK